MSEFQRRLDLDMLAVALRAETPWMIDLLRHWYPAGNAVPWAGWEPLVAANSSKPAGLRPKGLRLAIRNGYANFYCGGQSIAKVSMGRRLKAETHEKYVTDANVNGQQYVRLDSIQPQVTKWIGRSHSYQGAEKLFVERVCAANGAVIDLEMALPSMLVRDRLVAPRIDLVALEPCQGGWKAVFWEAKLTSDSRVRTRGEVPEVVGQLGQYAAWFAGQEAKEAVLLGYRETCVLLARLHNLAAAVGIEVPPLHEAVRTIAEDRTRLIDVDPQVRLLIDDRQSDAHFRDVHLPKLERAGIQVHLVRTDDDLVLPAGPAA